ncbi:hypothetical protein OCE49_20825 [Bacillus wiedmannii]|nr:hypothetical protein [Bacillus wiedmannii]MCU5330687.1 hypothetical protein [Bacillus wiedmannii]
MKQMEKRELLSSEIEIREVEGGLRTITGYAVKWEMICIQNSLLKDIDNTFL